MAGTLPENPPLRVASVVSALSRALDLSTGQPSGHSIRTCIIGMRIASELRLSVEVRSSLFYALLLKDCGCSANSSMTFHALGSDDLKAKRDVKTTDWTRTSAETLQYALTHVAPGKPFLERAKAIFQLATKQKAHTKETVQIRCQRGATLARLMGLTELTADGILNLDEHWDGQGNPEKLAKTRIPMLSRIMLTAQTLEVFLASGAETALRVIASRSGTWFDPQVVKAVQSLGSRNALFSEVLSDNATELCLALEPLPKTMEEGGETLDKICMAFASIVDAKSPYTFNHSAGVASAAVAIARTLGLPRERVLFVRHAALIHDLGKLSVSNTILEKPAKLDDDEWQVMKQHPFHTWEILRNIPGFQEMSEVAGSHHEKLDGSGYFRGFDASRLSLEARILAVADIFDALSAKRPYRDSLPLERVFQIIDSSAPHHLDPVCIEALRQSGQESDQTFLELQLLNEKLEKPV